MTDKRAEQELGDDLDAPDADRGSAGMEGSGRSGAAVVGADMQALIGRQLRAVYDDIAKQPVPDRFLELMSQLDSKPASSS